MVNWKKHDKVKYKNTTNVSYNNKSGGATYVLVTMPWERFNAMYALK